MGSNERLFEQLFSQGLINIERGKIFSRSLDAKPPQFAFDKIEGMLLGLAVGDSLGCTTESLSPRRRQEMHGEVQEYLPHPVTGRALGYPTDDTQLAFRTLGHMIDRGGLDPEELADVFAFGGEIFGIGAAVMQFLSNRRSGIPWYSCAIESAGNGALMRIAPVLIGKLRTGGTGLWYDAALAALITHNDRAAISSSLAYTAMLWELLDMDRPPDSSWWKERYVDLAGDLEGDACYQAPGSIFPEYSGTLCRFTERCLDCAQKNRWSTLEACEAWGSGAYLLETLPSVLYILQCYAQDPHQAIIRAVNDTRDNDTIASIVSAALGALYGKDALKQSWLEGLTGRTAKDDDGEIFRLIDQARQCFWDAER